jgi:hypothetical protein
MKLPVVRYFRVEDFPSEKDWISRLLGSLNSFLNYTYLALNRGLVFSDNFTGQEVEIDFTYQTTADFPMYFQVSTSVQLRAMQVAQALEGGSPIVANVAWDVTSDNRLRIFTVTKIVSGALGALTAGTRYQIRLRFTP